jgi:hypothetical protein
MTGRVRTPDFDPSITYRPAAAPVDTFAPPARDHTLGALVSALSDLQPTLRQYQQEARKEMRAEDIEAGKRAALESAIEWGEAVRSGKVPPTASKWFMKAYKEQYGRILGSKLRAEAEFEWSQWEGRESGDPEAIKGWLGDFQRKALKGVKDTDVLLGLLPEIEGTVTSLTTAHARHSADVLSQRNLELIGIEVGQQLDTLWSEEIRDGVWDPTRINDKLSDIETRAKLQGVAGSDLNDMLIQAVTMKAKELNDPRILEVLDTHRGNHSAGLTLRGREAIERAKAEIVADWAASESRAWTQHQRAARAEADRIKGELVRAALEDPTTPLDKAMLAQLSALDPDAVSGVLGLARGLAGDSERMSPGEVAGAYWLVLNDPDPMMAVLRMAASGELRDPQLAKSLIGYAEGRAGASFLTLPAVARAEQRLTDYFPKTEFNMPKDPAGLANAQFEFVQAMADFQAKNPSASPTEAGEYAWKKAAEIAGKWDFLGIDSGGGPFIPMYGDAEAEPVGGAPAAAAETAGTLGKAVTGGFAPQQSGGVAVSPEIQAAFEEAQSLLDKAAAGDSAAMDRIMELAGQYPEVADRLLSELQKGAGQ